VVLLNLVVISLGMIPSFREQVLPRIPLKLSKAYVALATAHATLGSVTELAALYILLAAGARLLSPKLPLAPVRPWMRTVLVLWSLTLLLGFATYVRWYVPGLFRK